MGDTEMEYGECTGIHYCRLDSEAISDIPKVPTRLVFNLSNRLSEFKPKTSMPSSEQPVYPGVNKKRPPYHPYMCQILQSTQRLFLLQSLPLQNVDAKVPCGRDAVLALVPLSVVVLDEVGDIGGSSDGGARVRVDTVPSQDLVGARRGSV